MAISVENSNLVWQKAKAALSGASPFANDAFKALKQRLATVGGNLNLQFVPIADLGTDAVIADAIARVWTARQDRYSEIRSRDTADLQRVDMSYIGG